MKKQRNNGRHQQKLIVGLGMTAGSFSKQGRCVDLDMEEKKVSEEEICAMLAAAAI